MSEFCGIEVSISNSHSQALQRAAQSLPRIGAAIDERAYAVAARRSGREGWGGADVVFITEQVSAKDKEQRFYPDPRTVVTPYAHEIGWLLDQLWKAFSRLLNSASKVEFFGRLANAAQRHIEKASADEDADGILRAILTEATAILNEIVHGTFTWLEMAPGGTIASDY